MRFDWDIGNNDSNRRKHGVGFNTAEEVFDDPLAFTLPDQIVAGEERWSTTGVDFDLILLVVTHVYRNWDGHEVIRIISARKADKYERKAYESGS